MSLSSDRFTGVNAAVLTPVTDDLIPDDDLMLEYSNWLMANGCDGLAILGTTGEANCFSLKERIRIIERLIEGGIPSKSLMPGTGSCALTDAVELTRMRAWHWYAAAAATLLQAVRANLHPHVTESACACTYYSS